MTILKRLTSSVAAAALTLSILTPVAVADRGDRERFNTRIDRVDRTDRRADRRQERRADRRAERRFANRVENRQIRRNAYRDGYRDARKHNYRHSGFRYHKPRRVHRSRPRYYKPFYSRPFKSRVIFGRFHRPNYHYKSHYHIGGFYGYHRDTVFIKDYWSYGLYDPPYGYHWVRDYNSGDVILASIATGAIIGLIIGALSY